MDDKSQIINYNFLSEPVEAEQRQSIIADAKGGVLTKQTAVVNEGNTDASKFLTFKLKDEQYAVEVTAVREVLDLFEITKIPLTPDFMPGIINVRGSVIPVVDMCLRFDLQKTADVVDTSIIVIEVISNTGRTKLGMMVDSVQEVVEIAPNQIDPTPKIGTGLRTEFLKGIGKRNDQFILILDMEKVFTTEELALVKEAEESALIKWLRLAESQICSFEILSKQFPEVNARLKADVERIINSFVDTASNIKKYRESVQNIIKLSGSLKGGNKPSAFQKTLQEIKDTLNDTEAYPPEEIIKKIDDLIKTSNAQGKEIKSFAEKAEKQSQEISAALSQCIIGMQFQDWVSQNLVIAVDVLAINILYLKEQIEASSSVLEVAHESVVLDKEFAKKLITQFSLGKLQQDFIEHLLNKGYIKDPSELNYDLEASTPEETDNNLTLF